MKINIITQYLFVNYGGILQNYALQEVLRRMGHEPLTVNVPKSKPIKQDIIRETYHAGQNLLNKLKGTDSNPFIFPYTRRCKEMELSFPQRAFIEKHIRKVDVKAPFTPTTADEHHAEVWIVGSDQVWRPWCTPYIGNYFFDFLKGRDVKRIAYAASFGTDVWEMDPRQTETAKELAKDFDLVTVREDSGIKLCKEHLRVDATHVLDPTLLLTREDYLSLTTDKDYPKGKYIAAYILDMDSHKRKEIHKISKEKGLPVKFIGMMHRNGFDSIESWLATMAHSEYVITDSFHGTAFGLNFGKSVSILGNKVRGNARMESLLKMLGVENSSTILFTEPILNRLQELRKNSIELLGKYL